MQEWLEQMFGHQVDECLCYGTCLEQGAHGFQGTVEQNYLIVC